VKVQTIRLNRGQFFDSAAKNTEQDLNHKVGANKQHRKCRDRWFTLNQHDREQGKRTSHKIGTAIPQKDLTNEQVDPKEPQYSSSQHKEQSSNLTVTQLQT